MGASEFLADYLRTGWVHIQVGVLEAQPGVEIDRSLPILSMPIAWKRGRLPRDQRPSTLPRAAYSCGYCDTEGSVPQVVAVSWSRPASAP